MGLLTLADFRTRLQRIIGNRGLANPELDSYINLGYSTLAGLVEFENHKVCAIFNTTVGVYRYQPPTRMLGIIALVDNTTPRRLRKIDLRNFAAMERDTPSGTQHRGQPRVWSRRRGAIMLWPTPDAVYQIEAYYYEDFISLSDAAHVTQAAGTWDWAVICFASYIAFAELGEDERSESWYDKGVRYARDRQKDGEWEVGSENVGFAIARTEGHISDFTALP